MRWNSWSGWLRKSSLQRGADQQSTGSSLNVVTAQTAELSSELSLLSVRNRELAALNQLLKNIAGRWQDQPAT